MKYAKKAIFFLVSLLPIQALAYAVDFSSQIETPGISAIDVEQEFLRRLENDLLHDKYYRLFEEHNISSTEELLMPWNSKVKRRALRHFDKELKDIVLAAGSANSMVPE